MTDITALDPKKALREYNAPGLPDTVDDLRDWIFLSREKLKAYRLKLSACDRLEQAKEYRDEALRDGQQVAAEVLHAEAKLGAILNLSLRDDKSRHSPDKKLPDGISLDMSSQCQKLAAHPEIIAAVIDLAYKEERIPTRREVVRDIRNRGAQRIEHENYPTPGYCIDLLLAQLDLSMVRSFLEPCKGAGAIYDRVDVPLKEWCEIREGRDYFRTICLGRQFDLIITNPPFSLAMEFLRKSLDEADTVIYLLRLDMLGSQGRRDFWNYYCSPSHLFPLAKRPSFTGNGTDRYEYGWFAWDRGGRIRADGWLTVL